METDSRPPDRRKARERILDAAAAVMRREGLVHATTKQIAREAACSEALLYKNFPDKQDIFLSVLTERSTPLNLGPDAAGTSTVEENLVTLTRRLLTFYAENFPMAASLFGSTELLTAHREALRERGAGPEGPSSLLQQYLRAEADLGRIDAAVWDIDAAARLLAGAALHEAFLTSYHGRTIEDPGATARRLVATLMDHPDPDAPVHR